MTVEISRPELESWKASVAQDFAGLLDLQRTDTANLRQDIKDIADKLNAAGRPQIQTMGFAFGIFTTVLMALAGVYTYMDSQLREEQAAHASTRFQAAEKFSQARHDLQTIQIDYLTPPN